MERVVVRLLCISRLLPGLHARQPAAIEGRAITPRSGLWQDS